jgi:hypothetical protein
VPAFILPNKKQQDGARFGNLTTTALVTNFEARFLEFED